MPIGTVQPTNPQADDLYITIQNPPGYITGVPTDVFGAVGTGSWGPLNTPIHMGSPNDAVQAVGAVSAASLTDPFDLPTDLAIAFSQAQSGGTNEGWAVRVSDGTDTFATGNLAGGATSAALTVTLGGTATAADTLTATLTSSAIAGSPLSVTYTAPVGCTLASNAAGLAALINANAALRAAGISALAAAAVVSIYQPTALSPQATLTVSKTGIESITGGAGSTTTIGGVLQAMWTGITGNGLTMALTAGAATATTTATLTLGALGITEIFANIPNAAFFGNLQTALAQGLNGQRGPSQIARLTSVNLAVAAPTLGANTVSGGTDGRAGVTTAILLGSNSAQPKTGLYALKDLNPAVSVAWIVGCTDATNAAATVLAFGLANASSSLFPFPAGTTTATALAAVATAGIHDPSFAWVKDWIYWYDSVNSITRLVPPTAFMGGRICTLGPQESPGNKEVLFVVGTERNNPYTGNNPYGNTEIGQLEQAGIMLITNPIPAGAVFGMRHGKTTSLNAVTTPFEWWRLSAFLARSLNGTLGGYVDQLQSQQPNDPLRGSLKLECNTFMKGLVGSNGSVGIIDDWTTICTYVADGTPGNGVNTFASVAQHDLYCLIRARYLSSVNRIYLSIQGGTTVVTVGAGPGLQLAA
jgi:hypothetical protein